MSAARPAQQARGDPTTLPPRAAAPTGHRGWSVLLWVLAFCFPVGSALLPWVWSARSHMPAVPRRLNAPIVLLTAAGLRADRLGHAGAAHAVTPALDRLAEQSVRFKVCYPASNQELPSAAALLTATCPAGTGVRRPGDVLAPRLETLAERLAAAGYRTAAVVSNPGLLDAGLDQGFAAFDARPGASADELVTAGLQQIRAANDGPWLLWLDFSELLPPYGGPDLDLGTWLPDAPPGFGADLDAYDLDEAGVAARGWGPTELAWMSRRYDAALSRLDAAIGRLVAELEAVNRLEMLNLCVTGLCGTRLDERPPRYFCRGVDLSEGSLNVPLILRLPAQTSRGMQLTRLAQGMDIAPTLLDYCQRSPWPAATGLSLKPAIWYRSPVNRAVFAEGLVQELPGGPTRSAVALRIAPPQPEIKAVLSDDGELLGAWRFPQDAGERESLAIRVQQLEVMKQRWRDALGPQADCLEILR